MKISNKFTLVLLVVLAILSTGSLLVNHFGFFSPKAGQQQLLELGYFQFNDPRPVADTPLKDLAGQAVTLTNRHQQWQLVNFGYMFCPDICPINLRLMADLKKTWDAGEHSDSFAITHITFDPERDTADRLAPYLDYHSPELAGLSGEVENIRRVAKQLNTVFIHEKPDEYGNYFITHSDSISLINPAGEYVGLFKAPYDKEKILAVLSHLMD